MRNLHQYAHRFFHLGVHVPFYLHFWGYKENELYFLHTRSRTMLFFVNIRQKKNVCLLSYVKKIQGRSVGIKQFFIIGKTGNSRSRFWNPIFHFRNFRLNDEQCSFSTFFALNFDKKLAVEKIKHCCWLNNKNGYLTNQNSITYFEVNCKQKVIFIVLTMGSLRARTQGFFNYTCMLFILRETRTAVREWACCA